MNNIIDKISASILIPFSGFYLAGLNLLSPIYLIFGVFLYLIPLFKVKYRYIIKDYSLLVVACFAIYILLTQLLLISEFGAMLNVLLSSIYYILSILVLYKLTEKEIINIAKLFIYISIILLICDTLWRFAHPVYISVNGNIIRSTGLDFFNPYKESSLLFTDSNFTGTYALCVMFLNYYLIKERLWNNRLVLALNIVIIVFTFSKSAIITCILGMIALPMLLEDRKYLKRLGIGLLSAISIYIIYDLVKDDYSFLTKLEIINLVYVHLSNSSFLDIIFGVGFGNAPKYIGIGAHNVYVLYLLESGLIGLAFFLFVQFFLVYKSNKKTLYVTFPLLVSGFSLVGHAIPFYYSSLALIYILNKKKQWN